MIYCHDLLLWGCGLPPLSLHGMAIRPRPQHLTFAMTEIALERLRYRQSSNEAVASAPAVVSAAVIVRVVILSRFYSSRESDIF